MLKWHKPVIKRKWKNNKFKKIQMNLKKQNHFLKQIINYHVIK